MVNENEGIDKQSPEVSSMALHWPMIDALIGGTMAMRKAARKLMPKWPAESDESFNARLNTATLLLAYSRTCAVMAAKPFARSIDVLNDKMPGDVKALLTDVDLFGTDLAPYLANIFLAGMQYGIAGVLGDSPNIGSLFSRKDQQQAGVRPYFAAYSASSILGWRSEQSADGAHLTQLRLLETVSEADGAFGDKPVQQIRVLEIGKWAIYRQSVNPIAGSPTWILTASGITSLKKIPFVFFYGVRSAFGIGMPPLLDLAFLNVEHWQSASDQQTILHVARIPILFAKGFNDQDTILIGASTAARASKTDADLRYVEHSGAAVEAGRVSLLDLEDRMRQTGAELLTKREHASKTTATEVNTEASASKSILQQIVDDFEESANACLELLGEWLSTPFEADLKLFKDFDASASAPFNGDLLLRAFDGQIVSRETAFNELKRLDVLRPDLQWADEEKKIKADPPPPPALPKPQIEAPNEA